MKLNRRQALLAGSMSLLASGTSRSNASDSASSSLEIARGKAQHCISIWLGGGMSQIDTFDPKRVGDPKTKKPGAAYRSIPTSVPGVEICEHLPKVAGLMEHVTAVRSVHHDVIDEHAAATNRMHTGRVVSGTITYPSLGSVVANQKGALDPTAPPYVLIGYPNVTRGPGFLGAGSSYLYLTDTRKGPAGLSRPQEIDPARADRRRALLETMRKSARRKLGDRRTLDYDDQIASFQKLAGPSFQAVFQLENEPDALRNNYGGEFGQRCLLARRLIQRGVRFVEVSHNLNFINGTGWDVHNDGLLRQHELIAELDAAMSTLITDLRDQQMLDKTLILVSSEFGRPPEFDGGGGRGHQGAAFTCVLAGGGLSHCGAYGETDELSKKVVSDAVSVPDLFATVHHALGIDPHGNLYDGDRPVPITDGGQPIGPLFAGT